MKFVKQAEWLNNQLYNDNIRIADCRFALSDSLLGQKLYNEVHIPGAIHFDLERDLSGKVTEHGGRHPLPDTEIIKEKLERAGINNKSTVIAYDSGEGSFAARLWWILRYLGHDKVYVLDGGFKEWQNKNFAVTKDLPEFKTESYTLNLQPDLAATYEEVKKAVVAGEAVLVDSRESARFMGLTEPIDKKPGHIPGAINKVWTENLRNGYWKSIEEQKERFRDLKPSDTIIVYCGSGVTATPNVLTLTELGYDHVKLYPGSYSDWISYHENPVESSES
ncbi:sulfurtransferase [Heyndrickxia acidicola]|uniref:Sulfurtransferase n=1 Tax=Heyndrickxia acidicola TaxID=209389 RepID=A0ABU6MQ50_9BACI|nr:sulfurtransferase [Heyndrickxia acidicola]MED1205352.1 sulfurtransferase [Heyndrickxia acidicola]